MRLPSTIVICLLTACGAGIGANNGDDDGGDDDQSPVDAGDEADIDAPDVDAAPACFNGRVVFLSFEGESLTQATPSDARLNRAQWMTIASGTAPPYRAGAADRATQIQAITDGIRNQLSTFPITVVTTRPQTGEYMMIVYGGQPNQVGSRFAGAVQQLDCNDALTRNDVAWVSDAVDGTQRIVNFSVGAIGFGLGLTATTDPKDCMCGWDNNCTSDNSVACTLTEGIARDPDARQRCANVTTQDETTTFKNAFCQ
jgi:hypothetical protein